ncbi:unnamed protein product, partial [Heterosigma akashiwo]
MVEGPGVTLNGEKVRGLIGPGKQVRSVRATVAGRIQDFTGSILVGAESLGKELFLFFNKHEKCIRLHFGMNGSLRFDSVKKGLNPALEIQLAESIIRVYESTFKLMSAESSRNKIDRYRELDVCYSHYKPSKVLAAIKNTNQGRLVVDVLLDQKIFPGSGNIIKNEALFKSFIDPSSKLENLSEEHLRKMVKMTRDFTNVFYLCRKNGEALHKHCRVYNRDVCLECTFKITVCRLGQDMNRMTYFCPRCQDNNLERHAVKGTLLGWATSSAQPWSCRLCTFLNKAGSLCCSMCSTPK